MHPFLQAQNLSYAIIVVEQSESVGRAKATFNRAKLFNVGFIEGFKVTHKSFHMGFRFLNPSISFPPFVCLWSNPISVDIHFGISPYFG